MPTEFKRLYLPSASPWITLGRPRLSRTECWNGLETLSAMVRCMLMDHKVPQTMGCELLFTAIYLSKSLPHAALRGVSPFSKVNIKQAHMTGLRVIGARAIVHTENVIRQRRATKHFGKALRREPRQISLPHLQRGERRNSREQGRHLPGMP